MDGAGRGRLLKYDPNTGNVTTLLCGLHFANGLQFIGPDRSTLFIVETTRLRIIKVDMAKLEADQAAGALALKVGGDDVFSSGLIHTCASILRAWITEAELGMLFCVLPLYRIVGRMCQCQTQCQS